MPRQLTFRIGDDEYTVSPSKVDRKKLYGWTEVIALDDEGDPCELLSADESGKYIIPLGGTGSGIMSAQGLWVDRSELVSVDERGEPAEMFRSSFDTVNLLDDKVTAQEFLDYDITDFYRLSDVPPEMTAAVDDNIYRFKYSYNDSYAPSDAFVMLAGKDIFLLIGDKNDFDWLCFGDCGTADDHDDTFIEIADEDLDFTMF